MWLYMEIVGKIISNRHFKRFQDLNLNWFINDLFILIVTVFPQVSILNTAHLLDDDFFLWQRDEKPAILDNLQVLPQAQRASVVSELQLNCGGIGNNGPCHRSPRCDLRRKVLTLPALLNLLLLWGIPVFLVQECWWSKERSYGKCLGFISRLLTLKLRMDTLDSNTAKSTVTASFWPRTMTLMYHRLA